MGDLFWKEELVDRDEDPARLRDREEGEDLRYGRLQVDADAVASPQADAPKAVGEAAGLAGHVFIAQATIGMNQRLLAGKPTSARPQHVMDEKVHAHSQGWKRVLS